jgi:hypothetical protein
MLAILFWGMMTFNPHGIHNQTLSNVMVVILFTIGYFIWQKFVTGRTQWTIDETGISMTWVKQFAFTDNEGLSLKWSEIEKCTDRSDGGVNYRVFKIILKSGKKYKFYHDTLVLRDDYEAFQNEVAKYLGD